MATDFGTDVAALTDLPDPEVLVSGNLAVAYAVARRWLTPQGALSDVGDEVPYASLDLREYLGSRQGASLTSDIERQCLAAAQEDPRVDEIAVSVTFLSGVLSVAAKMTTAAGPFEFVVSVDNVTSTLLAGG